MFHDPGWVKLQRIFAALHPEVKSVVPVVLVERFGCPGLVEATSDQSDKVLVGRDVEAASQWMREDDFADDRPDALLRIRRLS